MLVSYRPLAELRLDARPKIELLHEYLRSSLPADALIWTAVAAGCEEMTQPRSKCCQDNDIESVNAWLRKDAPDASSRPDVPIDTNLPDPALLPEAPPLYRRLPRLCAWAFREPLAALVHAVAFACCLVALFALLRPLLARSCAFGYALRVVLSFLTIRLLGTLFARYLLYQFALVYAFHRETTLRDMTVARLQFRSNRGSALFGIVVAVLGLFLLRGIAADGTDALCGAPTETPFGGAATGLDVVLYALVLTLPASYWVLYSYGTDPVEEQDIAAKRRLHQCSHQHSRG